MSSAVSYQTEQMCAECGRFGAYEFDGEALCSDCYQARGSCCAERDCDATAERLEPRANDPSALETIPTTGDPARRMPGTIAVTGGPYLKLNPNCCYKACPGCSSLGRLREFQSRHNADWRSRLVGPPRLVIAAQQRD